MATKLGKSEAKKLLARDSDQLYEMLGRRIKASQKDLSVQGSFDETATVYSKHMGAADDLKMIGRRMFNKLHKQAYELICGDNPDDEGERSQMVSALGVGVDAAVITLTGILISTFGIAAALASVVAAIVIKRFAVPVGQEGHAAMCKVWKEHLPN